MRHDGGSIPSGGIRIGSQVRSKAVGLEPTGSVPSEVRILSYALRMDSQAATAAGSNPAGLVPPLVRVQVHALALASVAQMEVSHAYNVVGGGSTPPIPTTDTDTDSHTL